MHSPLRRLIFALALALGFGVALAQTTSVPDDPAPASKAPPGFTAPADPKADDTNAQRAKSQPGNNAPFWRAVRESGQTPGFTTLPDNEGGTLVQRFTRYPGSELTTAGEAWRQVRNQWIIPYGGSLLLIVLLALAIFYWRRGPLGGHEPDTGRKIERFTPFERAAHWANAAAFLVLAVSGLVMAFGKFVLMPVIGSTLFGWLTWALKTVHNFVGPLFAVSLVIVVVAFARDNVAGKADIVWLKRAGGMMGEGQVPSHRFNAAEKGVFWWINFFPGLLLVGTGLALDHLLPGLEFSRGNMQIAHMIHAVAALLMVAGIIGHIYMGTVGVKGALDGMKTGWVDEGWAKEHHLLWYEDVKAGKIPVQRSRPGAADGARGAAQA